MKSETGICMYCGQVNQIEVEDGKTLTEEEKNTLATKRCTCEQAMNAQEQEKVVSDAERRWKKSCRKRFRRCTAGRSIR